MNVHPGSMSARYCTVASCSSVVVASSAELRRTQGGAGGGEGGARQRRFHAQGNTNLPEVRRGVPGVLAGRVCLRLLRDEPRYAGVRQSEVSDRPTFALAVQPAATPAVPNSGIFRRTRSANPLWLFSSVRSTALWLCSFFFFFEQASQLARSWKETGLLAGKCQLAALLFETLIRLGYPSER